MTDKEFFIAAKSYIESREVEADTECGQVRTLNQLIADGDMPEIYNEVLRRLNSL